MTELIYIFEKGKSSPKVWRHQNNSDVIKVSTSSKPKGSGTVGFFSKNRFQVNKICVEPKVFFTNNRPFSKLEATLLSSKNVLNIRFTLENLYIFGRARYAQNVNLSKTGTDVIIISTLLNPAMFGTVGFVPPKKCIQKYRIMGLYHVVFGLSPFFSNRKWYFFRLKLPYLFILDWEKYIYSNRARCVQKR